MAARHGAERRADPATLDRDAVEGLSMPILDWYFVHSCEGCGARHPLMCECEDW